MSGNLSGSSYSFFLPYLPPVVVKYRRLISVILLGTTATALFVFAVCNQATVKANVVLFHVEASLGTCDQRETGAGVESADGCSEADDFEFDLALSSSARRQLGGRSSASPSGSPCRPSSSTCAR